MNRAAVIGALSLTSLPALASLASLPAFAQSVPQSTTAVFFGNALPVVAAACIPPVAAILCGALWKLWAWCGFKASAQDKANMSQEVQVALSLGVSKAIPIIAARGWDSVDVHNEILAGAARYFLQRFPGRSAAITAAAQPTSDTPGPAVSPTAAVTDTLRSRLTDAITTAAASPATPPASSDPVVQIIQTKGAVG
jgi:hypothetical protein